MQLQHHLLYELDHNLPNNGEFLTHLENLTEMSMYNNLKKQHEPINLGWAYGIKMNKNINYQIYYTYK